MDMIRKRMFYTIAVTLVVVFSTTYAILMTLERMDYRNYLQGEYTKNMFQLINNIENIDDDLSKSAVAGTKEQNMIIFQNIFRYSSAANDKLNSLPIPVELLQGTNKFLSQVGDYCYTLVRASSDGRQLTDDDYKTIDRLQGQSAALKLQLHNVLADINRGRVSWGDIRKKITGVMALNTVSDISGKFTGINKQAVDYPALIYDGPFSDNVLEITPKVNNLSLVSAADAEKTVRQLLKNNDIEKVDIVQNQGKTRIDSYSFNITMKGRGKGQNVVCDISKHGGKVVYLLDNKSFSRPTIDDNTAISIGTKFLSDVGFKDMRPTFWQKYEDNMIINYVHYLNNVAIYPEQIKLKIALDDSRIIGIEAEKYLTAYDPNRKLQTPSVSQDAARKSVSSKLNIRNIKLAVVPSESNKEILCYEFAGTRNNDEFIVYVNASTGNPQKILRILNTPNGKLTI